jgi:S1-C subfamily serine protease
MEELTKYQIVLLTLFTSFVTSLATGIVTVSLMDQSPQGITQNINRVVERTIERVVEGPGQITQVEVPVVVSEEDLIVKVVNAGSPSVVKVVSKSGNKEVVGVAFAIAPGWVVAGSLATLDPATDSSYELKLESGKTYSVERIESKLEGGLTFLKYSGGDIPFLSLSSKESQIGQSVVVVGSKSDERHSIAVGIISGSSGEGSTTTPTLLRTNAATTDNIGGPVLNIKGETIGLSYRQGIALSGLSVKTLFDSIR